MEYFKTNILPILFAALMGVAGGGYQMENGLVVNNRNLEKEEDINKEQSKRIEILSMVNHRNGEKIEVLIEEIERIKEQIK